MPGGSAHERARYEDDFLSLADALRSSGADPRFVLTRENKRAFMTGWPDIELDDDSVVQHIRQGKPVGLIPWTANSAVLDVDEQPSAALDSILEAGLSPWATVRSSKRGRFHHYCRTPKGERNVDWLFGEVRGDRGYVILHHPKELAEQVPNLPHAPEAPLPPTLFPERGRRKIGSDGKPVGIDRVPILGDSRTIPVGQRSRWLYRRLLCLRRGASEVASAFELNRTRLAALLPAEEVQSIARCAERTRAVWRRTGLLNRLQAVRGRRSGEVRWARAAERNEAIRQAKAAEPQLIGAALAVRFDCSLRTVRSALADR